MSEVQGNPGTDRKTKINDRIAIINSGLTQLYDQANRIRDLIQPMLKNCPPTAGEENKDQNSLLVASEENCELIVLLDNIIEGQVRLIDKNVDLISRIDV